LYLANTFTGAKFEKPLNVDQTYIIDASSELVFNYYGSLQFDDLKIAFEMAVSNKLEGVNLETYYGKFSVKTLSAVLNAYQSFRSAILLEFRKINDIRKNELSKEEIASQNEMAQNNVKENYKSLVQYYIENSYIDETKIFPHWGKILVEAGVINFSAEEKKQIYEEAKGIVSNNLKSELAESQSPAQRKSLIKLLGDIAQGNQNEEFLSKTRVKYSYLIVLKSILQSNKH